MKSLRGWDTYVAEANEANEQAIELPLTDDESYIIPFPTRRQGKAMAEAQRDGDTDALLVALLGEQAGQRVIELSEDEPSYVLDAFLVDVMKSFGFISDEERVTQMLENLPEAVKKLVPANAPRNGKNGSAGKAAPRKRASSSRARASSSKKSTA